MMERQQYSHCSLFSGVEAALPAWLWEGTLQGFCVETKASSLETVCKSSLKYLCGFKAA